MYSAYHKEGYRACLDAELERFFTETETGKEKWPGLKASRDHNMAEELENTGHEVEDHSIGSFYSKVVLMRW